jgi:hypothetical protein
MEKIKLAKTWSEAMEDKKLKRGLTAEEIEEWEEAAVNLGLPRQGFHLTTRQDLIIAERKGGESDD